MDSPLLFFVHAISTVPLPAYRTTLMAISDTAVAIRLLSSLAKPICLAICIAIVIALKASLSARTRIDEDVPFGGFAILFFYRYQFHPLQFKYFFERGFQV